MITKSMKKFLIDTKNNTNRNTKDSVYKNRMQKRITRELDNLLWLCLNFPEDFLDEEREYKDDSGKITPHRRLRKLLFCIKALKPKMEVELVLQNLDFPDGEITR